MIFSFESRNLHIDKPCLLPIQHSIWHLAQNASESMSCLLWVQKLPDVKRMSATEKLIHYLHKLKGPCVAGMSSPWRSKTHRLTLYVCFWKGIVSPDVPKDLVYRTMFSL